ncbi:MAG: sugar ABC transporter permease [Betaproteobacteria bacterium]|nr:sugar ABC transporter permease [Betaproteobacteria bacterium]
MLKASIPYLFLSPFFLLFGIFGIFPIVFSFVLMFQQWDPVQGLGAMQFVGLENIRFTLEDPWVWKSLGNTFWLAIASGLPQHLVAVPLAYLINEKLQGSRNALMGAYFLPYITSTVAIAMMFTTLFSTDYGLVNALLETLQQWPILSWLIPKEHIDWLGTPETIKPVIALVVFWRYLGFNLILYVAALQSIPRELYEAARMDGAREWRIFWSITLPQLKPMMVFSMTLSVIGGLQLFEEPFILTGGKGGVEQAGMTTAMYMYRTAFEFNDFGLASAMSWLLFLMIAVMTWLTNRAFGPQQESI